MGDLVLDVLVLEVVGECIGAIIVKLLEAGAEAAGDEEAEETIVRQQDLVGCPCWHWIDVDAVAVVIAQYQHVEVTGGGFSGETTGSISVDLAGRAVTGFV